MNDADAQIDRILNEGRKAEARLRVLSVLQTAMSEVTGSASNRAGTVRVTVALDGVPTSVKIFDSALSAGGARLSMELMSLLKEARVAATEQAAHIAEALLADDPEMLEQVLAAQEARLTGEPA